MLCKRDFPPEAPPVMKFRTLINGAAARLGLLAMLAARLCAQAPDAGSTSGASAPDATSNDAPETWNISWQATSIGQAHDNFHSPYQGPESLNYHAEAEASLTTTLFTALRLARLHRSLFRSGNRRRQGVQQCGRIGQRFQRRAAARGQRDSETISRAAVHHAGFRIRRGEGNRSKRSRINWAARGR